MKYPSSINFEKEISDKKLFGINRNLQKIQLPASKFITKKNDKYKKFISFVEGPIHFLQVD